MASELRPVLLLTLVVCALAASLVIRTHYQSASAVETPTPGTASVMDQRRFSGSLPKPETDRAAHRESGHLVAHVRAGRAVAVRLRPNGRVLASLGSRTEFGSSRALSVVRERRGRWLGVTTPQLPNGKLGWVDARSGALRYSHARVELEIDLSRRQLLVRRAARILRRMPVSIGRSDSPTPTGRFAVTDKLPGWTGGNRLAIHGTPDEASVGGRASAGCLHARASDLRSLMKSVPLGSPVRIHA
jgi:hypothetical protein